MLKDTEVVAGALEKEEGSEVLPGERLTGGKANMAKKIEAIADTEEWLRGLMEEEG